MSKINVLGINYNNVTIDEAADEIYSLVELHNGGYVVTPNAEIAEESFKQSELKEAIKQASVVLPDGAGVVLASKILSTPLVARAAGFDVSKVLLNKLAENHKKLYILGSKPGTADTAAENVKRDYPGIQICGTHHGYFKEDFEVIELIKKAEPDVIFVALGYPRQEIFMKNHRSEVNAVMLGVGGSIDVFAGFVKRSPDFFIKHNIEWLYRLGCQPSRFIRMLKLPKYILRAIFWKISGKQKKKRI